MWWRFYSPDNLHILLASSELQTQEHKLRHLVLLWGPFPAVASAKPSVRSQPTGDSSLPPSSPSPGRPRGTPVKAPGLRHHQEPPALSAHLPTPGINPSRAQCHSVPLQGGMGEYETSPCSLTLGCSFNATSSKIPSLITGPRERQLPNGATSHPIVLPHLRALSILVINSCPRGACVTSSPCHTCPVLCCMLSEWGLVHRRCSVTVLSK